MLRSLPNDRLSQRSSAALTTLLPLKGGGEWKHVPPIKAGCDCAASTISGNKVRAAAHGAGVPTNPSLERKGPSL